jgi:hypothetical protein
MKYRIRKHIISSVLDMSKTKPHTYYTIEKLCWKLWQMEHWTCITNFEPIMKDGYTFSSLEEAKNLLKKYAVYIKECESDNTIVETIEL